MSAKTGKCLSSEPFLDYIRIKYSEIYGLLECWHIEQDALPRQSNAKHNGAQDLFLDLEDSLVYSQSLFRCPFPRKSRSLDQTLLPHMDS